MNKEYSSVGWYPLPDETEWRQKLGANITKLKRIVSSSHANQKVTGRTALARK